MMNKKNSNAVFIFAHGAGAGQDSDFMQAIAKRLETNGVKVVLFDFPYMQKMKAENRRRPPDRMPKLIQAYQEKILEVIQSLDKSQKNIFIAGKSMGGRVASMLASSSSVIHSLKGVICLGFPFHPPKSPDKYRGEHLENINLPVMILQGERDPFGTKQEVENFNLSKSVDTYFIADGDHSFKPRVKSGHTLEANYSDTVARIIAFMNEHSKP